MTRNGFSPSVIESLSLAQIRLFLSAIDNLDAQKAAQSLQINALAMGGDSKAIKRVLDKLMG